MKKSIITEFLSGTPSSTYSVSTGYSVSSEWINTDNGNRFYHKTDGNWVQLDSVVSLTASAFYATQSGKFQLKDGTQGSGYLLTSDTNGVATWVASPFSSLQSQINTKQSLFTGTTNYLPKSLNSTTLIPSRIQDTGTYIGISTINPPAKDLTFVGTKTIEIGLEDYSPILEGKDLNIAAGRAVNFAYGAFSKLNFGNGGVNGYGGLHISPTTNVAYIVQRYSNLQTSTYPYTSMVDTGIGASSGWAIYMTPQNNLYLTDYGNIYKRTNNTGAFVSQASLGSAYAKGITSTSNGDLYYCIEGGDIYKQTNQTGTPVALGQTTRSWTGLAADASDNIYACVNGGDVYKRVGTASFVAMGYTTRAYTCITITPIGDVYLGDTSGNVWKQTLGAGAPALFATVGLGIAGITCDSYSNLYITIGSAVTGADVYFNLNSTTGTADLQGGTLKLNAGTGKGTGASNLDFYTGQRITSGTDMQTSTLRTRINNEGLMTLPSVTNTLINADTTGKAVVTKEWVSSLTASAFYGTQSGKFRLQDGTQGSGYLLTSDANGVATWVASPFSSLQSQINTKQSLFTGTVNYLPKSLTSTTLGVSRIQDNGTYVGINTIYPLTRDLALGNQASREIGVEMSDSLTIGRDLTITAGQTINYALADFVLNNTPVVSLRNFAINRTTLDVYATSTTGMYRKPANSDSFTLYASVSLYVTGICVNYITNDIWTIQPAGVVNKQTGGSGSFVAYTTTGLPTVANGVSSISVNSLTNDVWVVLGQQTTLTGKLYKQTGGTGSFVEYVGTPAFYGGKVVVNPLTNDIFLSDPASYNGGKFYKQTGGTGSFVTQISSTTKDFDVDFTTGTVYAISGYDSPTNGIYKQTSGAGAYVLQTVTYAPGDTYNVNTGFTSLWIEPVTLNVSSVFVQATERIYKQINYAAGTADLQGGTLKLNAGTGKGTGASNLDFYTGQKTTSGTDMQISTLRSRINNEGLMTLPSVTNALINADTTGKAVTTKEWVSSLTATKQSLFTGTVNYLPKSLTSTTLGVSRIQDDGSFLGIGSVSPIALTKDIQLGRQANKEIGIEQSDSVTIGRDLIVTAGRTINYDESSLFLSLNQGTGDWRGISSDSSGNIYTVQLGVPVVYKQTGGTGNFAAHSGGGLSGWIQSVCVAPNGNIYVVCGGNTPPRTGPIFVQTGGIGTFTDTLEAQRQYMDVASTATNNIYTVVYGGDIYMQTAGTGAFNALSQTSRAWTSVACASNGDVYATVDSGDIYVQTGGTGAFTALGQTSRAWYGITVAPNGNVYAVVNSGDIYVQTGGIGTFTALGQTSRLWSDICVAPNGNIYATVLGTGDIFMQTNSGVGTADLQGGTLKLNAGTGKGIGDSNLDFYTGQKTTSGTDMQISTLRSRINNEGLMTLPSVTNSLINADTTGKAVVTKEWLSINNIIIATTSNITTNTTDSSGYEQNGRNVMISNGNTTINLTCEITSSSSFVASYTKLGTSSITFVAGVSASIVQVDGTLVLDGIAGSTACLTRTNNTYYLQISNR